MIPPLSHLLTALDFISEQGNLLHGDISLNNIMIHRRARFGHGVKRPSALRCASLKKIVVEEKYKVVADSPLPSPQRAPAATPPTSCYSLPDTTQATCSSN